MEPIMAAGNDDVTHVTRSVVSLMPFLPSWVVSG